MTSHGITHYSSITQNNSGFTVISRICFQRSLSRQAISYLTRDYATLERLQLSLTFTGASNAQPLRGFAQRLALLTFQHWSGLSPYTSFYKLKQGPVFLINSRQEDFRCAPPSKPVEFLSARIIIFFQCLSLKHYSTSIEGGEVLFRSYDHFFAEFLQELSPVRLNTLTPAYLCRFLVRNPLDNIVKNFLGRTLLQISPPVGKDFCNT